MKADLHCHSFFSDGNHSPAFLLQRAQELQISHLAITDHDHITVLDNSLSNLHCVKLIPGVEVSCQWKGFEIHVVGIGVDAQNKTLQFLLNEQRTARRDRISNIGKLLEKHNIIGLSQYMQSLECVSMTRSHVSNFLISSGKSKNQSQAFNKYLGKKGRAFVPSKWISLAQTNEAINGAGGISVLAHPGRYSLNKRTLGELIDTFKETGGLAIETSYGNINPTVQKNLETIALDKDLYVSAGSDFHSRDAHWTDLGKFPAITTRVKHRAIWAHPRWPSL